jgi:26S proteasome regulatory subunit N8
MWVLYAASLIRSIIALHNLINNKLTNKESEKKETGGNKKEEKEKKETGGNKKEEKEKKEDKEKKAKK